MNGHRGVWRNSGLRGLWCAALLLVAQPASAYRPFDSTDAAVADQGVIEIECGPLGYAVMGPDRFIVVPAVIFNLGLSHRWELVVEGKNFLQLDRPPDSGRQRVEDSALSAKRVMRPGTLQDQQGPSIALEVSMLLPTAPDEHHLGSALTGILSQQWSWGTVHINEAVVLGHEERWMTISGAILEGPSTWRLRPVAEATAQTGDQAFTALAGGIWTISVHLSLDAGFRWEHAVDAHGHEFRAGFTWGFAARRTDPSGVLANRGRGI